MEPTNRLMVKQIGRESYNQSQYIFLRQVYKSVRNGFSMLSRCVQIEMLTVAVIILGFNRM
jgi:hypothetical protein